jgi:hypothetical protein
MSPAYALGFSYALHDCKGYYFPLGYTVTATNDTGILYLQGITGNS